MKVFISWSGEKSRQTAILLSDWIKCVLQATQPWMSQKHIDRGALWFTEINLQLQDTTVGIVCLTKENQKRPWILFESGALAKGLSSSRVCTFLVDLKTSELEDPLAQFNHTLPERDSVRSLVGTLNACLGANALPIVILEQVFETYWPKFEEQFSPIKDIPSVTPAGTSKKEIDYLAEILDTTRALGSRLNRLEDDRGRSAEWNRRVGSAVSYASGSSRKAIDNIYQMLERGESPEYVRLKSAEEGVPRSVIEQLIYSYLETRGKNKLTPDET